MTTTMRTIVCALVLAALAAPAHADAEQARAHYKKGLAYFALGKYADAAAEYEAAFEAEPDAALLYNAAVAHRQAGNKARALTLFQSFGRQFGDHPNAPGAARQAAALKAELDAEKEKHTATPTTKEELKAAPAGDAVKPAALITAPAPAATTAPTVSLVATKPSAAPAERPRTRKWVWGVVACVAAVAAVGIGVGLGVGLSGDRYPSPTVGTARVP